MRICPQCHTETEADRCPKDGFATVDKARFFDKKLDPLLGTVFAGRYRVERIIGRGGMGAVYQATQLAVDRPVALKILKTELADDLKEVARFQQEARAIATLQHPNTIRLIDFGATDDGSLFLVMEFLEGEGLSAVIKREAPLEPKRVMHIGLQILEALSEAHNAGIVHRDLKPENIMLTEVFGKTDFVKLLDFGIAKVAESAGEAANLTKTGMFVGSPRYMAPEQVRSQWVSDRTDIYALGALMYEMLCGHPVFSADTPTGYLIAHVQQPPDPPTRGDKLLVGPLVDFIMQCLEKQPDARPAGAVAAIEAVRTCLAHPAPAVATDQPAPGETRAAPIPAGTAAGGPTGASEASGRPTSTDPAQKTPTMGGAVPVDPVSTGLRTDAAPGRSRNLLWAAIAATVLLGAAAALLLTRGGEPPRSAASPAVAKTVASAPQAAKAASTAEGAPGHAAGTVSPQAAQAAPRAGEAADASTPGPADAGPSARAPSQDAGPSDAQTAGTASEADDTGAPSAAPSNPVDAHPKSTPDAGAAPPTPAKLEVRVVNVTSRPSGATVLMGGNVIGTTPIKVQWMEGSKPPTITVRRHGRKTSTISLVEGDAGTTRLVKLKPKRASKPKGGGGYETL